MRKILEKLIIVLTFIIWIEMLFISGYFANTMALFLSGILLIIILPVRNLLLFRKTVVKNIIYYIGLFIILLFTCYYCTLNVRELLSIDRSGNVGYSTYLIGEVYISYAGIIFYNLVGLLFKRNKEKCINKNTNFKLVLIFISSMLLTVFTRIPLSEPLSLITEIASPILSILLIMELVFGMGVRVISNYQKIYLILFIASCLSLNFTGIILTSILYIQLDKTGVSI